MPKWTDVRSEIPDTAIEKFFLTDKKSGNRIVKGPFPNKRRVKNLVDRMDNKYGGYRYGAISIYYDEEGSPLAWWSYV